MAEGKLGEAFPAAAKPGEPIVAAAKPGEVCAFLVAAKAGEAC